MSKFSFVIPCYNSQKTIEAVISDIHEVMSINFSDFVYDIILVNDCSKDGTWDKILELSDKDDRIFGINLAKNVGQHGAIMAGLKKADGDYVILSDDDGQTPVKNVVLLYRELIEKRYDVVCAKYVRRDQPSLFRRMGTKANLFMSRWLLELPDDLRLSVFVIMKSFVAKQVVQYTNPYPYFSGIVLQATRNIGNVEMEQLSRASGQSGYSVKKLISLWMNGFTAFSIKPLRLATTCGIISSVIGVIMAIVMIIRKLVGVKILTGWSSTIVLLLIIGGLILFALGMIGEYIGRIYMCVNSMPQYVVKEYAGNREECSSTDEL